MAALWREGGEAVSIYMQGLRDNEVGTGREPGAALAAASPSQLSGPFQQQQQLLRGALAQQESGEREEAPGANMQPPP